MKKAILFVDDERQILKAIRRLFMDTQYNVFFAENGEEALRILEQEAIHMIITDMRMPNMDGYQLLKKVKEKYPLILRLILSGYAEENLIFKALQNNLARLYLLKPWDNQKFIETINQIFETEALIKNDTVLALVNNLDEIPTIPALYHKLCSLIDEDVDIKAIANTVEQDPSISAKLLHIANSAFYGAKTGSVNQAILYLGLTNIRNVVLSTSVFSTLKMKSVLFNKDLLWRHSCMCNKMVSLFYEKALCKSLPNTYMTAGLLHDIGKIALLNNFGEKYKEVINITENDQGMTIVEAEKEIMNISHQEMGGYLLSWWELPHPIVESTLFHHSPLDDRIINKELVAIVHIADNYSWQQLGKEKYSNIDRDTYKLLGISEEDCRKILSEVEVL
ncbi:response regulator [Petroclostridium sp. X23]|uniref:response regulator n=1 Tax=Petroclostridium sp. X23 TaxID=3045146 RepID=UPI0024AE5F54|nr:response regulator [Petroclostridium sp. X23]WHH59014.1 response regulator [Petroclostridium sp. X23]